MKRGPRPKPLSERYVIDAETGCWVWQGGKGWLGYGRIWRDGRQQNAHRWMYEQVNGPVPEGHHVDHLCRNSSCVNPDHLEAVTAAENIRRGKLPKLTREQVIEIKRSSESGAVLAKRFGVGSSTVYDVRSGRCWADVEEAA